MRAPLIIPNPDISPERGRAGAFMEAYFSNFIEGTEFAIGEAVEIVFEGRIPENRPADGHDVLGTYLQLVELGQRSAIATDADTFIDRSEEHTSELQSLMRISYAVFCLKKTKTKTTKH